MSSEIPALHGEFGPWTHDFSSRKPLGIGPMYPTRSLLNEHGETVAWLRLLSPTAFTFYSHAGFGLSYIEDVAKRRLVAKQQKPHTEALGQSPDRLSVVENYGLKVAPRFRLKADVDAIPSMVQLSPNVEGVRLDKWLESNDVTPASKQAACSDLSLKLSGYARDAAIANMRGDDFPFFFDISSTKQYVVTPGREVVMIDTGPEEAIGSSAIMRRGLMHFHNHIIVSGFYEHLDSNTINQIVGDLIEIQAVESEMSGTGYSSRVIKEWQHPGRHLH